MTTMIEVETNGKHANASHRPELSSDNVRLDSLGFLDIWSCAWIRAFYVKSFKLNGDVQLDNDVIQPNESIESEAVKPTLHIFSADSCSNNVEYIQDLYRREEAVHGKINSSMLRVCFALCRNRLLLATGAYLLHLLTVIVAITVFLYQVMWATNEHFIIIYDRYHEYYARDYNESNRTAHSILNETPEEAQHLLWHNIYFSILFVLMMWMAFLQRSFFETKLLSAATMLRNACAGAVYDSSLKSSVQSNVASYQTMALFAEDGDAILEFIQKGGLIAGHSVGIALCMFCGFIMVGFPAIWATIGVSIMLLVAYLFSITSSTFYRKSLAFHMQKMAVADEYCQRSATNSKVDQETSDSNLLGQREIYKNRFSAAISGQFWALFRSEALRPSFTGAITLAILLTFLSIMAIIIRKTYDGMNTENIMCVGFLFVYVVSNLISDWSDSTMALHRGAAVLDKVKSFLSRPAPIQPCSPPNDASLQLSIQNATFEWDSPPKTPTDKDTEQINKPAFSLEIKQLLVKKNSIVGITGEDESGKSSLVLALLGHMPHRSGDYCRSGSLSYYPEKPYVLSDCSIQKNIMFAADHNSKLNEDRYKEAVSTVQMHMNQGFDCIPMTKHALDVQWLQKISLARAVYEENENTIILENPLSGLDSNTEISDVFSDVATKLQAQGKTVIVISQDENVLRHCQHLLLIENGSVNDGSLSYEKFKNNSVYKEIIRNYRNQREVLKNSNVSNNLQTTLNLSTEDLVTNKVDSNREFKSIFNPTETLYLILLNMFMALIHTMLPVSEIIYYFRYDKGSAIALLILCLILVACTIFGKHYVHRTARRSTKRLQRGIFDRLLHTSPNAVNESVGVSSLNAILDSNFHACSVRSATILSCWIVLFSVCGVVMVNGFWGMFSMVMVIEAMVIFYVFRCTIAETGKLESFRRLSLLENVHNDLGGRVVLQSFDHIHQSRNRIFALMDDQSSSVYLNKSIIFFAQFIFTLCQAVNLPIQMVAVYHDVYRDDSSYMIALYLFFLLSHNIYKLIEIRLLKILSDQKLQQAQNLKNVTEDISTLKFS